MALTSDSTLQQALAQYNDNLAWDGSATKAAAALEAVRWLLINRPQSSTIGGNTINYAGLEAERERLEAYVSRCGAAAKARRSSFVRGRMRVL